MGLVISKSGLNTKFDIESIGVIDEGYTGSICVKLQNHRSSAYMVNRGDKISQLVVVPISTPDLEVVEEFETTERGNNGFGSTGI
jgi:dUTP pyrophosphatase